MLKKAAIPLIPLLLAITPAFASVEYYHTDALGTPVAVTDEYRTVVERSEYEPYGVLLNRPLADGPGYTGHVSDAVTGLSYMQQRYYDPEIGRFLSVDPVTADGNTGGNFNRYWYANNNPYKFTDPDGRLPDWLKIVMGENPEPSNEARHFASAEAARAFEAEVQHQIDTFPQQAMDAAEVVATAVVIAGIPELAEANLIGRGGASLRGLGNPFKGKSPKEIDGMFKAKGFDERGPDPLGGKGGYVNPETGRSYHIDPESQVFKKGVEEPHVDVNRSKTYEGDLPKKKYPLE